MRFHAPKVSASVSDDYYHLNFSPEGDEEDAPLEAARPYLLLQREFGVTTTLRFHSRLMARL